jgi:hypothetical protein
MSITDVLVRRRGDKQTTENARVNTMMFYDMSQQYHAERIMTGAERRRADAELGMMAAAVSRRWQRITPPPPPARAALAALAARVLARMKPAQRAF